MKNHVLRPLWVAILLVIVLLVARKLYVPDDFGVNGRNFTYGYHRKGSIDDWKAFKVKYRGRDYCKECHEDRFKENGASKHRIIQCENCHGPAVDHQYNPEKLELNRSRALCL
ncbi:MAG: cytochrome C, partial [Pseudomonadota bacterium]